MFPHGETITVMRPEQVDDGYGGTTAADWVDHHRVCGVAVAPAFEDADPELVLRGRQGEIIGFTLYVPPGSDINKDDRIRVRGRVVNVDGSPAEWSSPYSSWRPGAVVRTRFVEG